MAMTSLRLAVMSDIHATDAGDTASQDTHVFAEPIATQRGLYPLADLEDLVEEHGLRADILLVPGDIANKANAEGLQYGWRRAHALASRLCARLLAAPGNHDVVTRRAGVEKNSMLRYLLPSFPSGDPGSDDTFWRDGWSVVEEPNYRVLTLDSTAGFPDYPASAVDGSEEMQRYLSALDRGALRPGALTQIEDYLRNAEHKINVAMVHHHPLEHQLKGYLQDTYGPMHEGGNLVDVLSQAYRSGRWLIVHGHKHIPQLVAGTPTAVAGPVVLGAASLGAKIWPPLHTVARNQFHLVELELDLESDVRGLVGTVESFTWGYGVGWDSAAPQRDGLPAAAGFGATVEPRLIARHVKHAVDTSGMGYMSYSDVCSQVPDLRYLLPADNALMEKHARDLEITLTRDYAGQFVSFQRENHAA